MAALKLVLALAVGVAMGQTVPFVGCPADGQAGPVAAPTGGPVRVLLPARVAAELAYYKGGQGSGVLAPRGWRCFEKYGSSGQGLVVRPGAVSFGADVDGPAVVAEVRYGGTSGRFTVARVIARLFPGFRQFVDEVRQGFENVDLPSGPVATDVLKRRGARVVDYRTPGGMEGMGTESWLKKEAWPIDGVVALVGETPDLVRVNVRLPERLRWLAPFVLGEAVRGAGFELVPFVGCPSDGQRGPLAAPVGEAAWVPVTARAAVALAYYQSVFGQGVLGPRGWQCGDLYGSSGDYLVVRPGPVSFGDVPIEGPVIIVSNWRGESPARWQVGLVIARVFPDFRQFVDGVMAAFETPATEFPSGPFPGDRLTYRGNRAVIYRTEPGAEGLGTLAWVRFARKGPAIEGVAVLVGDAPDLKHVSMRLPERLRWLAPSILGASVEGAGKPVK